ncbi:MAG: peptide ABC transporter substrate-binding protein [Lachnospiraceae bacterium]|nr:peptide ABC transporter substrate-binding protein [Lachnospiraceae bacterium]
MKKKISSVILCVVLSLSLLAGCGGRSGGQAAGEGKAKAGREGDISIALDADVTTLDNNVIDLPADFTVVRAMQDGLMEQTDTDLKPGLAESYEVSPDGLTYTFHLRDAKYSNGEVIKAEDFVTSWRRLVDPETGSAYAWFAGAAGVENADAIAFEGGAAQTLGISAPDEKTVVVKLDRQVPFFTAIITMPCFAPVSEAFVKEHEGRYGQSGEDILSSGAFMVDEWVPGSGSIRLKKNPEYWNAAAVSVETLTFRTVMDEQSGILSYQAGDLDVVGLHGDMAAKYASDPALDIQLSPKMEYLYLNHSNSFLSSKALRQALSKALNKDDITKGILKDGSESADYFVPKNFAYDDKGVAYHDAVKLEPSGYDTAKALELWEEAGKELGTEEVSLELLYDDTTEGKNIAQYLKSSLEKALPGLTVELREVPYAACWDEQKAGNFDMTISSWMADYIDPSSYFDMLMSTNEYNLGNWNNPEYDGYCRDATTLFASDPEARREAYGKAEQVILEDVGLIPLYQTGDSSLIRPGISVKFAPFGSYLFRYATKTQE